MVRAVQFADGKLAVLGKGKLKPEFLVKHHYSRGVQSGIVQLGLLHFPKEFVGKKVRILVEEVEDE